MSINQDDTSLDRPRVMSARDWEARKREHREIMDRLWREIRESQQRSKQALDEAEAIMNMGTR